MCCTRQTTQSGTRVPNYPDTAALVPEYPTFEIVPYNYVCLSMSPEANKIKLYDVTTHYNLHWHRHFFDSIRILRCYTNTDDY